LKFGIVNGKFCRTNKSKILLKERKVDPKKPC